MEEQNIGIVIYQSVEAEHAVKADKCELHSELLCFITDKCKLLPADDLTKLCCDFYHEDEILEACAVLANIYKLPKRKGSDRLRSTMEDIVKTVLNPDLHLPLFYATDLSRLPLLMLNIATCLQSCLNCKLYVEKLES